MGGLGCISHGIKLVFMHYFEFLSWMGWFLMGSPGRNEMNAPGGGWGWLGKEGGSMLSRYSDWLSRPWM